MNKMDKKVIREVRKNIPGFEEYLQARYQLISEAVGDVITIARMNTYEDAVDLISKLLPLRSFNAVKADVPLVAVPSD